MLLLSSYVLINFYCVLIFCVLLYDFHNEINYDAQYAYVSVKSLVLRDDDECYRRSHANSLYDCAGYKI